MNPRAFVVDVTADSGNVIDLRAYGEGDPENTSTWLRSQLMGIGRYGNDYVAVGTQYDGEYDDPDAFGDAWVIKLGNTLGSSPLASVLLTNSEDVQDTGYDVAFAGDGSAHVAVVEGCGTFGDGYGHCFRDGASGHGEAVVHRLSRSNLSVLGTTGDDLGDVLAFDLQIGLTALSDGRVALVSTKQLVTPDTSRNEQPWWRTDAFVAILDSTAEVEWMTTHDARTSMPHTGLPGGPVDKYQECVYDIAEAEDGGLVISGNTSSNWDDYYVVRFAETALPTLPAPNVAHSHLVYPTTLVSDGVMAVAGDLTVNTSGRLWVDPGRTLAFGEDARLFARGELVTDEATLTAQDEQKPWGGVVVATDGTVATLTATVVEHAADAGVAVYAPARVALAGDTLRYNGVGLGVYSDGDNGQPGALVDESEITDNGIGLMTDFTCTWDSGSMPACSGFTSMESSVHVLGSVISENIDEGVLALNAALRVEETLVENNGEDGITLVNATAAPFVENVISANGSYGVGVLVSGEFFGSPTTAPGEKHDIL
jgi:hypothetical protein